MKEIIRRIFKGDDEPAVKLLAVRPSRTGTRTMLGVENVVNSIAVPEPFALEIAGDADGVALMVRCGDKQVVKQQIGAHYPQAMIDEVASDDDPMRLREGEQAWSTTLRLQGPEYLPLRTFRDDDLLDQGSDPLIALIGSMSDLDEGERVVARLSLSSLGPDWSQPHLEKAQQRPAHERPLSPDAEKAQVQHNQVMAMGFLLVAALPVVQGYLWVQRGETWKTVLLGVGAVSALALVGWAAHRFRRARRASRMHDPALVKEKTSRIAFEARLDVTAILSPSGNERRAEQLLSNVAAAYRHYDNAAGARFKVGKVRPAAPGPAPGQERARRQRGGGPVAPSWVRGRDADGTAFGGEGAAAVDARRQGRRSRRSGHGWQAGEGPYSQRHPEASSLLRCADAYGQVDADGPPDRLQDEREGCGPGRRRHNRDRPARRPGGLAAGARAGGDRR